MSKVVTMPKRGEAPLPVTEDSLAVAFAMQHRERAMFDHHSGKWFLWGGQRWARSDTGIGVEMARELCRGYAIQDGALAGKLGKAAIIHGVESLARTDRLLAVTSDDFDRDPMLLGTPDGTINLYTGDTTPGRPKDYITKSTAVSPAEPGTVPAKWLAFLNEATGQDGEVVRFLQAMAGYCLTGLTTEHALFFVFGPGGNGKSVFLNTLCRIMGDYAATAPMETFTASQGERHPTELAMLRGARLVAATETEEGRAWAEARIKQLTGGDPVSARFMRRDFFTFRPAFKLLIVGNHKPVLRNVDDAARRRFRLVPFVIRPAEPNPHLEDDLQAEWPAILRWMIDGCIDWQAERLGVPEAVRRATDGYFDDQDLIAQWLLERCDCDKMPIHPASQTRCAAGKLFSSWAAYSEKAGEKPGTIRRLSMELERRGYLKKRTDIAREFIGVRVKIGKEGDDA